MTVRKIKIIDDDIIRNKIDQLYEKQEQIILAKWSLEMAKHIIEITNFDISKYSEIEEGFKIHKTARIQQNELDKNIVRVIGQAVASGHMREHSMVTSDYAIKVINILYNNDTEKIKEERLWQLEKLTELSSI